MSALDRMLGREPREKADLGPLGGLLSSVVPPQMLEDLKTNVTDMVNYFKRNTDISVKQGALILEQQRLIMDKLGIEYDGRNDSNGDGGTGNTTDDE
jgi:hypothetical protein